MGALFDFISHLKFQMGKVLVTRSLTQTLSAGACVDGAGHQTSSIQSNTVSHTHGTPLYTGSESLVAAQVRCLLV